MQGLEPGQRRAVGPGGGAGPYLGPALEPALRQGLEMPPERRWAGSGPGQGGSRRTLQIGPDRLQQQQQLPPANRLPRRRSPGPVPGAGSEPGRGHVLGPPG